jgi:hypothetical protein
VERWSVDELDIDWRGNEASLDTALKKLPDRSAPRLAIIQAPVIHVQADEGVCLRAIESAGILHGMIKSGFSMLQSIRDAVVKMARNLAR